MKLKDLPLTFFLSVVFAPQVLCAVNSTWDGSSNTNLLTNTNWSGNRVPDNNATFNSTALNYTPSLTSGTLTVHQFVFPSLNAQSYTFSLSGASSLIFNGGANNDGVHNDGGLTQTFNLSNTAQITFLDRSGADEGNQPGHITYNLNAAGTKLNFDQAHNLSFGSLIQGLGQVSFGGSATQTFTSINTYTGSTFIQSGTLALSGNGSIATSGSVLVNGVLDITGISANSTTIKNLSGSGSILATGKGLIVNSPYAAVIFSRNFFNSSKAA